ALHSLRTAAAMVSNTGRTSVGDWLITRRILLVASCCSNASARRCSSSATPEPFLAGAFLATSLLVPTFTFAGFAPRAIDLLPPLALRPRNAGLQARPRHPLRQVGRAG